MFRDVATIDTTEIILQTGFTDTELIRENTDENVLRGRQLRLFAVQPILQRSKQVIYYLLFHYFLQIMKQSEHTAPYMKCILSFISTPKQSESLASCNILCGNSRRCTSSIRVSLSQPQFERLHFYASFDGTTSSNKARTTTLSASPASTVISSEPEPSPTAGG